MRYFLEHYCSSITCMSRSQRWVVNVINENLHAPVPVCGGHLCILQFVSASLSVAAERDVLGVVDVWGAVTQLGGQKVCFHLIGPGHSCYCAGGGVCSVTRDCVSVQSCPDPFNPSDLPNPAHFGMIISQIELHTCTEMYEHTRIYLNISLSTCSAALPVSITHTYMELKYPLSNELPCQMSQ